MTDRLRYNLDATDAAEIRFLVDAETLGWLERESARTGISLEKIASAMLRKACNETPALGAPGATVSVGRAEAAEVGCDAGRRSAMNDRRPRCAAETIEIDEAFASEAEACDFAEVAARDVIDGLCEYARCGVRFVDIRYADECLGGDSV